MKKRGPAFRHVLLLSVDALRFDALGCEFDKRCLQPFGLETLPRTPNLDAFARGGVHFTGCRTASTVTPPSHATIFTGQYPYRHDVRLFLLNRLAAKSRTLFERLNEAGFSSIAGVDFPELFQLNDLLRGARLCSARNDSHVLDEFNERARRDERVFLFLHMGDVHATYGMTENRADFHRNKEIIARYERLARALGARLPAGLAARVRAGKSDSIELWNAIHKHAQKLGCAAEIGMPLYFDGANRFDQGRLKRFFAQLERRGLLDETLVVITADHGEGLVENSFGHGDSVQEDLLRVPLIFWCADPARLGLKAGTRVDLPVSTADIAPTLLGLLGIGGSQSEMDGVDRSSLIAGKVATKDALQTSDCYAEAWSYGRELGPFLSKCIEFLGLTGEVEGNARPLLRDVKLACRTVREGSLKYIEKTDGTRLAHDVSRDPLERVNLLRFEAIARAGLARELAPALDPAALKRLESRLTRSKRAGTAPRATRGRPRRAEQVNELEQSLKHLGYLE